MSCLSFASAWASSEVVLKRRVDQFDSSRAHFQLTGVHSGTGYRAPDGLLQLRVLRFGFLQDRDVGVGVFPEGEEILVGSERPSAGGVGIRSLRSSRLQGVGTSHAQMCQRSR